MNCRGCGVEVDPSQEQVNRTVDQILETSLQDAQKKGGVCAPYAGIRNRYLTRIARRCCSVCCWRVCWSASS